MAYPARSTRNFYRGAKPDTTVLRGEIVLAQRNRNLIRRLLGHDAVHVYGDGEMRSGWNGRRKSGQQSHEGETWKFHVIVRLRKQDRF